MHTVHFETISPDVFPRAAGSAIRYHHGTDVDWLVDATQLDPRMPGLLSVTGSEIAKKLKKRNVPASKPWGEFRLLREEIHISGHLPWRLTPSGIYIPVPRHLITATLACDISILGTSALRLYVPPPDHPLTTP